MKELMVLVHRINERTPLCAFLRYHGHVAWVEVSIAKSKRNYDDVVFESYRHGVTADDIHDLIDETNTAVKEELQ